MSQKRSRSSQQRLFDVSRKKQVPNNSQMSYGSDSDHDEKPDVDLLQIANHLVRYILLNLGNRQIFRRYELQKVMAEVGKAKFDSVLEKLEEILENVYGVKLQVLDNSTKGIIYLVVNKLDSNLIEEKTIKKPNEILLFLILAHIFMSLNSVSDKSLFEFLNTLEIDVESKHPIFGNVKDTIQNYMIKNRYLKSEVDPVTQKVTFSWGPRADIEISKTQVLTVVSQIYGVEPAHFADQFQRAEEQDHDD